MHHIFLDTNVLQHYIQRDETIVNVHKKNLNFYSQNKLYALPQVVNEMTSHELEISQGLGEIIKIETLSDHLEYSGKLLNDLHSYTFKIGELYKKTKEMGETDSDIENNCKKIIGDIGFYINGYGNNLEFLAMITGFDKEGLFEYIKDLGIDREQEHTANDIGIALGNIIEMTKFGDIEYYGFSYKDINRGIGNFMFDYKNYKRKKTKAKLKVGKDSMVIFELLFWINRLGLDIGSEKIIFISSDYRFVKEIRRFIEDIKMGIIDTDENYKDLSEKMKRAMKDLLPQINILKLDIEECIFENNSKKDALIYNII